MINIFSRLLLLKLSYTSQNSLILRIGQLFVYFHAKVFYLNFLFVFGVLFLFTFVCFLYFWLFET